MCASGSKGQRLCVLYTVYFWRGGHEPHREQMLNAIEKAQMDRMKLSEAQCLILTTMVSYESSYNQSWILGARIISS